MAQKKRLLDDSQLTLPGFAKNNIASANHYWRSSLFNDTYLLNDLPLKNETLWQTDYEGGPFYDFFNGLMNLSIELKGKEMSDWSEEDTVTQWIIPVMELLGWGNNRHLAKEVSFSVTDGGARKTYRPDLLYVDDPSETTLIKK
jgi:hypothetical protein